MALPIAPFARTLPPPPLPQFWGALLSPPPPQLKTRLPLKVMRLPDHHPRPPQGLEDSPPPVSPPGSNRIHHRSSPMGPSGCGTETVVEQRRERRCNAEPARGTPLDNGQVLLELGLHFSHLLLVPLLQVVQHFLCNTGGFAANRHPTERGGSSDCCTPPCVTFRLVVVPLRGPGQSPILPFTYCVGSLLSVGRCGRCSCWCRFRVRKAQ